MAIVEERVAIVKERVAVMKERVAIVEERVAVMKDPRSRCLEDSKVLLFVGGGATQGHYYAWHVDTGRGGGQGDFGRLEE